MILHNENSIQQVPGKKLYSSVEASTILKSLHCTKAGSTLLGTIFLRSLYARAFDKKPSLERVPPPLPGAQAVRPTL